MIINKIGPSCFLGEGPLWHPKIKRLFWFDILKGELHSCDGEGNNHITSTFPEPASAAGWIDENQLLIAQASSLVIFNITTLQTKKLIDVEADRTTNRSNDGRVAPDGSFWFGTMGLNGESGFGSLYRYAHKNLQLLEDELTVPNSICFSPDGTKAFFSDTRQKKIWFYSLDNNGSPVREKKLFADLSGEGLKPDGSVCDSEGYLWNAQWGASRLARYAPDGTFVEEIKLPVSRPTCPVFGGEDFKTLFITSAQQGLSKEDLLTEPDAGKIIATRVKIPGKPEYKVIV